MLPYFWYNVKSQKIRNINEKDKKGCVKNNYKI